jgi:hypothetical protein
MSSVFLKAIKTTAAGAFNPVLSGNLITKRSEIGD